MTNLDSILKGRDITLPKEVCLQGYGFSSGHVWMWELNCEESWAPKNWCFWTVVLEKTLGSPLDLARSTLALSKEIKPVNPKGNHLNIHWKDWYWSSSTLATWCDELIYWERPWFCERSKAGGEEGGRGWDGWMTSPTQRTWIWVNTGR